MKKLWCLLVLWTVIKPVYSQEVTLKEFEFGNKVFADESLILVTGCNFREDGNGQIDHLYAFDHKLRKKWELKLDKYHSNEINDILFHEGQIIVTGHYGEVSNTTFKAQRFILFLDYSGKKLYETIIGESWNTLTNLLVLNKKLYCCYLSPNGGYNYADLGESRHTMLEMDLETKQFSLDHRFIKRAMPLHLTAKNGELFVFGKISSNGFDTAYLYRYNSFRFMQQVVMLDHAEIVSGVVNDSNGLTLVYHSNPYIRNQEKYLRFDSFTPSGLRLRTKKLNFSVLGLDTASTFTDYILRRNELCLLAYKNDRQACFLRLDAGGRVREEIPSSIRPQDSIDFLVMGDKIIQLFTKENQGIYSESVYKLKVLKR